MIYVLARSCLAQWDETKETYPPGYLTGEYLDFWTTKCRFMGIMGSSSHHGTGLETSSFARPGISEGTIRVLEAYETQRSWRRGFSKRNTCGMEIR